MNSKFHYLNVIESQTTSCGDKHWKIKFPIDVDVEPGWSDPNQ
jgi:hypothetical protein